MTRIKRHGWSALAYVAIVAVCTPAPVEKIALLRGQDVVVVGPDGRDIARLTADNRPKGTLAWLPDGQHLSYLVANGKAPQPRLLVVVDLTGRVVKEVALPPPSEGLRSDEATRWVSDGKVRIETSANPRNCEVYDFDIETSAVSNGQLGACGSFVASPDGKHIAHLGLLAITSDDDRIDSVEIDNESIVYSGGGDEIRVDAGPVWSEDSKNVAFIERKAHSTETSVTVLSMAGQFTKVALPARVLENPIIAWIDSQVVVGAEDDCVVVDHLRKNTSRPTAEALERIGRIRHLEQQARETRTNTARTIQRLGGREGVRWPE